MVGNEEFDVLCACENFTLTTLLWQKETLIRFCTSHGLPPDWLEDEAQRISSMIAGEYSE